MYKLICKPKTGGYDCSLPSFFEKFPRDMRGHNKKIVCNQHRLDIRKFSFTIRNVELWNSLPQQMIDSNSIIGFENKLDNHWGKQELYFDNYKAKFQINKCKKPQPRQKGPCQSLFERLDTPTLNEGIAGVSPPYLMTMMGCPLLLHAGHGRWVQLVYLIPTYPL